MNEIGIDVNSVDLTPKTQKSVEVNSSQFNGTQFNEAVFDQVLASIATQVKKSQEKFEKDVKYIIKEQTESLSSKVKNEVLDFISNDDAFDFLSKNKRNVLFPTIEINLDGVQDIVEQPESSPELKNRRRATNLNTGVSRIVYDDPKLSVEEQKNETEIQYNQRKQNAKNLVDVGLMAESEYQENYGKEAEEKRPEFKQKAKSGINAKISIGGVNFDATIVGVKAGEYGSLVPDTQNGELVESEDKPSKQESSKRVIRRLGESPPQTSNYRQMFESGEENELQLDSNEKQEKNKKDPVEFDSPKEHRTKNILAETNEAQPILDVNTDENNEYIPEKENKRRATNLNTGISRVVYDDKKLTPEEERQETREQYQERKENAQKLVDVGLMAQSDFEQKYGKEAEEKREFADSKKDGHESPIGIVWSNQEQVAEMERRRGEWRVSFLGEKKLYKVLSLREYDEDGEIVDVGSETGNVEKLLPTWDYVRAVELPEQ